MSGCGLAALFWPFAGFVIVRPCSGQVFLCSLFLVKFDLTRAKSLIWCGLMNKFFYGVALTPQVFVTLQPCSYQIVMMPPYSGQVHVMVRLSGKFLLWCNIMLANFFVRLHHCSATLFKMQSGLGQFFFYYIRLKLPHFFYYAGLANATFFAWGDLVPA